jgi:hypothetical protein
LLTYKQNEQIEKLEMARKMKEMGDSAEKIRMITGLPPETVKEL